MNNMLVWYQNSSGLEIFQDRKSTGTCYFHIFFNDQPKFSTNSSQNRQRRLKPPWDRGDEVYVGAENTNDTPHSRKLLTGRSRKAVRLYHINKTENRKRTRVWWLPAAKKPH
jgi:hypothetical protein